MNEPLKLTDHKQPVLCLLSPAQAAFLKDLRTLGRGNIPFWGLLEVEVRNGETVGLGGILKETRVYGG